MLFGIKEIKEFASNHEDSRVVAIWNRLNESRMAQLEDLLRWRDAEKEPPKSYWSGLCLVANPKHYDLKIAFWAENKWNWQENTIWTHWRPVGNLPSRCDGTEGEVEREGEYAESVVIYMNIIRHMWANSRLSNFGYDSMTEEMKLAFNRVVGKPIGDRNI